MELRAASSVLLLATVAAQRTQYLLDPNWRFATTTEAAPMPGAACASAGCQPNTNDGTWRQLDLPHDFVVEGNFSEASSAPQGYLPETKGWYRRHLLLPAALSTATLWLTFDGIQTQSYVYLNGHFLGFHASGYTASQYFFDSSVATFGADNVLAVFADGSKPDGWWYDGGGIYRHVWLTAVATPGPFIAPWGVYAPCNVTGAITWSAGAPFADATMMPSVEIWNNAMSVTAFSVALTVRDASGAVVATASGSGSVLARSNVTWTPSAPIAIQHAALWHLVDPPLVPALYTLSTTLSVGAVAVDAENVTFGVRTTRWDAATGFYLNGVATKIKGMANHQDFAAVGVAVPDVLQLNRISILKAMGSNAWRTAHNAPNPALLDAADSLGFLVWDENHRNGQDSEVPLLVKRDRNHPSIGKTAPILYVPLVPPLPERPERTFPPSAVIWSICNEILCKSSSPTNDARRLKGVFHDLDPLAMGGRPASANSRNNDPLPVGPATPLDVIGIDYTTEGYDAIHASAPDIPAISSESSSSYSDRDEYGDSSGHVSAYNEFPDWGQSADMAWGGINVSDGQGILTRSFIAGGFTWTGHDYRGEETPTGWPAVNSHFGCVDMAGFPKDRYHYYRAWFNNATSHPVLHVFPHWDWTPGSIVKVWAYSNSAEVELFVNDVSQGRKTTPLYGHLEWNGISWVAGSIRAVSYASVGSSTPVAEMIRNTTGVATAIRLTVKDGVGANGLIAGCQDAALVQVEVIDAAGLRVFNASNVVTFSVSGPGSIAGTANGDPTSHVNNKSPTRQTYHGLVMAVVLAARSGTGTVLVTATTPGLPPVELNIPVSLPPAGFNAKWCRAEPTI